jgi:hypothetical protein
MNGHLRAFVSSTMRDLANERAEVITRLEQLNLEPIRAEKLSPTGQDSWGRIQAAIAASDIFVLILGESYGFIPETGPRAEEGKSVTELEFDYARSLGLPVLAFFKKLGPSSPRDTEDRQRRDAFRTKVEAWDGGVFRSEFELARDLAMSVGAAVVELITDTVRTSLLVNRKSAQPARHTQPEVRQVDESRLPPGLVSETAAGRAVLLLGAGASLQAGMPSAAMFVDAMTAAMRRVDPGYRPGRSGTTFNAVATDYESLNGQEALWKLAHEIVEPGFAIPTDAHRIAGRLFDTVVTTNYDRLFEQSLAGGERRFSVIDGEATASDLAQPLRLIKLHGSLDQPTNLVLTESQLANLEFDRPKLWSALVEMLRARPLFVVGSSLRDPSLIRLLEECRPTIHGWAVLPDASGAEHRRLRRWNLTVVEGEADGILLALEAAVRRSH